MTVYTLPLAASAPIASLAPRRRGYFRTLILDAADGLLREHGLEHLTMEMVAQEAGLVRRTIYNHFGSITDLFTVSRKRLLIALTPLVPTMIARDVPPPIALTAYARRAARLFADKRRIDLMLSVVRDGRTNPWLATAYEQDLMNPMREALKVYFGASRPANAFEGDPNRASHQLLWTLEAAAASPNNSAREATDDALMQDAAMIARVFMAQYYGERSLQSAAL